MSFGRNVTLNLIGQGAPLVAAAICIPILISKMGTDRFGVLTIAWMVIGYFSLFDLGLGRALTRAVSEKIGLRQTDCIPVLVCTALVLMVGLGVLAGGAVAIGADALVVKVLKIPEVYALETKQAFWLLAVSIPFVVITTGLRGVLEAYQRFDLTNMVRVPMGVWTFAGPLVVLPWTVELGPTVAVLVAGRVVTTLWHAVLVAKVVPGAGNWRTVDRSQIAPLLKSGGWMSVSNLISPIMGYMDRFFISGIVGLSVVAFYTTPYEVIFKMNILPEALFGVLFPLMTAQMASMQKTAGNLFVTGIKILVAVMFPATLVVVLISHDFLHWWVGPEFALKSTLVMQLLAIGIFINSMAKVPYNVLQAAGRADVTAKLHLLELPIYIGILLVSLHHWGIVGAAIAWSSRMAIDFVLLSLMASKIGGIQPRSLVKACGLVTGLMLLLVAAIWMPPGRSSLLVAALGVMSYVLVYYRYILSGGERQMIHSMIRQRMRAA